MSGWEEQSASRGVATGFVMIAVSLGYWLSFSETAECRVLTEMCDESASFVSSVFGDQKCHIMSERDERKDTAVTVFNLFYLILRNNFSILAH